MKGVLQAREGSSKEWPVATARNDPSQPSPTEHATSTLLLELSGSVSCSCEPLRIWEALWERSVKASAACSWMGESLAASTVEEEGDRSGERNFGVVKVSCQCQELWPVLDLPHFSRPLPACPCLCLLFGLSSSLKFFALLPSLPCTLLPSAFPFYVSPFLAPHPLLFCSSQTAFFHIAWGKLQF